MISTRPSTTSNSGAPSHQCTHHQPVGALLRRGAPAHQVHPPLQRREVGHETCVRDPYPSFGALAAGVGVRPRASAVEAPRKELGIDTSPDEPGGEVRRRKRKVA